MSTYERFKVGDRVRIPQYGWEDTPHHDGTVTAVDDARVFVVWDDGPHTSAIDRWFTPDETWSYAALPAAGRP